jgi:hypothetical protein
MSRRARQRSASTDEFLDSYVFWREACEDVRSAYRRWMDCAPEERGPGFAAYRAALEREAQASKVHSARAQRLGAVAR